MIVTLALGAACQAAPTPPPTQPAAKTQSAEATVTPDRVSGTVRALEGNRVTLADGTAFAIGAETRITRSIPATFGDVQAGEFAAITAKPQPDGSLLASIIRILPMVSGSGFLGQFPMQGGDLMTNAEIVAVDAAQSNAFSVKFPGGTQEVRVAPDAQMSKIVTGNTADIVAGSSLSASVVDGVARSISLGL
jgi:hypothetical protein